MKIGTLLPTFSRDVSRALHAATTAEELGVDGVFCYDHLWPLGHPGRPAISPYPLLAAVAVRTTRVMLGTLVSRVGLEGDEVLAAKLETIAALARGRVIAALGTGDAKSDDENDAFGIAHLTPDLRRRAVARVGDQLEGRVAEIWVGGGAARTNALAPANGWTLNLWAASPARVARAARKGAVSWAGELPASDDEAVALLAALREAGATWACASWATSPELLVELARRAG